MKKKIMLGGLVAAMVLGMVATVAMAGNGAPSGAHKNLNIIGAPKQKNANFDGGNGSRIFVKRTGQTVFYVYGGDAYEIKDHDGTDGKVGRPGRGYANAGLVLPYEAGTSGIGDGGAWQVQIYMRLVGPKTSKIEWTTEYWDGDDWVLLAEFDLTKSSKFSLKTSELLVDGYRDILWKLDPVTKFRTLQLRLYFPN